MVAAATLLAVTGLTQPALAIVVGVNIDVHQDCLGPPLPNDFHIVGRVESGVPLSMGGGGWADPPVLIDHIDDMFPMFHHTIMPDLADPEQNWYLVDANWDMPGGAGIPHCTILHLGLFFDVTCHNVIIDLVGWWTRDGMPLPGLNVNSGAIPLVSFRVEDQTTPQWMRVQNDSGHGMFPGIAGDIVGLQLAAVTRAELLAILGDNPFAELRLGGMESALPWTDVLFMGLPISEFNFLNFDIDSFFDVFLDGSNPFLMPAFPITIAPGGFLLAKQLLRYEGNDGSQEFRWHWEIHGAHPPPPPPPPPPPIAGINVDIHQDNPGGANDFHVEGRIESGAPGGNWSSPPLLIDQVNDLFPFWNIQITPDLSDPGQNWYLFTADWWGADVPFCSILHLGLFFQIVDDWNVIIDLKGWWTLDGQPIGTGINLGYVPTAGFDVAPDLLGRGQRIRIQNGNNDGAIDPSEIQVDVVEMGLSLIPPGQLQTLLGPEPFRELRLGGQQQFLSWLPVEVDGVQVSESNPLPLGPDSFFDVFFELPQPGQPTVALPFTIPPEGFLVARERLRFINNNGDPDFRWVWEIHGAFPTQPPESDLGDAPDSSNNFFLPMTAYPSGGPPGVLAGFPTVYGTGSPPHGPIHLQPSGAAYLGVNVSLEQEADIGADQDLINNIVPPNDLPDMDNADDGVVVPLALPNCMPTMFNFTVTVPAAGPALPMFVNVWFDWNRDGDWDDFLNCPGGMVTDEWAVHDQLINLPPGTHVVTSLPFVPWHPPTGSQQPIWMRITIAEQPYMPQPGQGYGGAGPAQGNQFGETEDYYFVPEVEEIPPKWSQLPHGSGQGFDAPSDLWWQSNTNPPDTKWEQRPSGNRPALHAHDSSTGQLILANDWLCLGGRVTDLHWWGTIEPGSMGVQSGFVLSIHNNNPAPCLPLDPALWSANVPLGQITVIPTGLVNSGGEPIFEYQYVLPMPFDQVAGNRYWLNISSISVNPQVPAMWKWQLANPLTVLCQGAAKQVPAPGAWQTIAFAQAEPAFRITSDAPPPPIHRVVADDFISDGRPIRTLRWWGSYFDPRYEPPTSVEPYAVDGWLISFYWSNDDSTGAATCPPDGAAPPGVGPQALGIYFAPTSAIEITPTGTVDCFNHNIYEYRVSLSQCCLICAEVDPRNGAIPAQIDAFYESWQTRYWLGIQAEVGAVWVPSATQGCEIQPTPNLPPENGTDFWGWHTSPGPTNQNLCNGLDEACVGMIVDFTPWPPNCWFYGDWNKQPWLCPTVPPPVQMAFELITDVPAVAVPPFIWRQPKDLYGCVGRPGSLQVWACGSPLLNYQWYLAGPPPTPIPGANSDTLAFAPLALTDAGQYYVDVSNGSGLVTSNIVTVYVTPAGSGDVNFDGLVDGDDIQPFCNVLFGGDTDPGRNCAADINGDLSVTNADVPLFVSALLGP